MKFILSLLILISSQLLWAQTPEVKYLENEDHLKCPTGFVYDRVYFDQIEELVEQMDFSPACIWKTIKKNATNHAKSKVQGFAFGSQIGASYYVGGGVGTELVMFPIDDQKMLVSMVRLKFTDVSVSLAGVSRTQSVVFGNCTNGIEGYMGWFRYYGAAAMLKNTGITRPITGKPTGCDSITSIRGMNSPVVVGGYAYYEPLGRPIIVTGPRVQPLLNYIKKLNRK